MLSTEAAKRGALSYNARQRASNKVDFPAPVGPEIAKMPADRKGSAEKSSSTLPSIEVRFFNRIAMILIFLPPLLACVQPTHKLLQTSPSTRQAFPYDILFQKQNGRFATETFPPILSSTSPVHSHPL